MGNTSGRAERERRRIWHRAVVIPSTTRLTTRVQQRRLVRQLDKPTRRRARTKGAQGRKAASQKQKLSAAVQPRLALPKLTNLPLPPRTALAPKTTTRKSDANLGFEHRNQAVALLCSANGAKQYILRTEQPKSAASMYNAPSPPPPETSSGAKKKRAEQVTTNVDVVLWHF